MPPLGVVNNPAGGKGQFKKGNNAWVDNGAAKSAGRRIMQALGAAALDNDDKRVHELVEVIWDCAIKDKQEWAVKLLMARLCGPDGTIESLLGGSARVARIEFVVVDPLDASPDPKEITATYTSQ